LDYVIGYGLLANFRKKIIEIYPPIKLDNSIQEISIDGVGVGTQIIGFLGRISREKNIEILLDAIPYLEKNGIDFVVAIAGPQEIEGEEKYKEKIFDLLTRYKNRIRSLGKLSEGQKNNFLKKCDCLVLPSNNPLESFGMVVAEAMTLGTPSVVSDIPGVRVPVLKTGIGETFKTNDTRDLADKIKKILSVKVNKKTVALRAREHFNLDKTIDSYESFFC
jgi:glycosyltransferase involved in cell wall biosynthesis